jgi:hypothetical protein
MMLKAKKKKKKKKKIGFAEKKAWLRLETELPAAAAPRHLD